jgi:hypothetical protein
LRAPPAKLHQDPPVSHHLLSAHCAPYRPPFPPFDSRWVPPVGGAPSRHTGTGGATTGVQSPVPEPFWWLEAPHKATRSPGRVTPQHPRSVNGIRRTKATSADIDYLRLLFPACQVGRAPPWTACRATQPPHGDGRSSYRHLQTPGRLCQQSILKQIQVCKLCHHAGKASRYFAAEAVIPQRYLDDMAVFTYHSTPTR